jgi:hypothetical protein
MCDIDIDYFETTIQDNNTCVIFTPKQLIRDIIWDESNSFIPFSNGKRYYVYQDLAFQLIEFYEERFPYINLHINNVSIDDASLPSLVVKKIKTEDLEEIISLSHKLMTKYINKKFCLLN